MNTTENSPYVVGVDGSVGARHAIRWASRAAVMHKAPVLLLHAIGVPEHYAGVLPPSPTVFEALWGRGNALLDEAAELAESFGVVDVRTEIREHSPNAELRDAARDARMLVLGAPGHGRLTDVVALSALAPQLSSHVACPVVVVHGDQIHPSDAPILVGIDGSPLSEQALAVAFEEASLRGVALTAIHAWEGWHVAAASAEPFPDWPTLEQMERLILAERLADWSDKYPDVTVYREITQRGPGPALVEASRDAQLVVVGSRGRGGFHGLLLGATSQQLIYHAACPVMVVRPAEE